MQMSDSLAKSLGLDFSLPANIRELGKTLLGAKETITEKDLSPEDLNFLKNQVQAKKKKNEADEQMYKDFQKEELDRLKLGPKNLLPNEIESIKKRLPEREKQIESYEKTKGKTSVNYRDYPAISRTDTQEWPLWKSLKQSFSDPEYRMQTLLGRYNAYDNKDGTVTIVDKYDWNDAGFKGFVADGGRVLEAAKAVITSGFNPEVMGNTFIRTIMPHVSRDIRITVPID
jgi:hypothetical protein